MYFKFFFYFDHIYQTYILGLPILFIPHFKKNGSGAKSKYTNSESVANKVRRLLGPHL